MMEERAYTKMDCGEDYVKEKHRVSKPHIYDSDKLYGHEPNKDCID